LEILESKYFTAKAQELVAPEPPRQLTPQESLFVSQINLFVKKSDPAIKKDLGVLQKKILTIDQEAKK